MISLPFFFFGSTFGRFAGPGRKQQFIGLVYFKLDISLVNSRATGTGIEWYICGGPLKTSLVSSGSSSLVTILP